ncbi:hypothetical protein [Jiangella gansuensis]|uniref:hypothetical protein n=1 Tax=Jiangella gansuensis TaxID=281473 RepID=UPI00047CC86E|nr:hypothetical protein [Jiangella gansuensis]
MTTAFEEDVMNTLEIVQAEIAYRQQEVDRMVAHAAQAARAAFRSIRDRIRDGDRVHHDPE